MRPYSDMQDQLIKNITEKPDKQADLVLKGCVAVKWENSFVQAFKQTVKNHDKRYSRVMRLQETFLTECGEVSGVNDMLWQRSSAIIADGPKDKDKDKEEKKKKTQAAKVPK